MGILLSVSVFTSVPCRSTQSLKMVDAAVQEKLEAGFAKLQAADNCKSLLKKYLTREVLDKTKDLKTSFGSTLLDVVQSGWRTWTPASVSTLPMPNPTAFSLTSSTPSSKTTTPDSSLETNIPPATSEMSKLWATWTLRASTSSLPACVAVARWKVTHSTLA